MDMYEWENKQKLRLFMCIYGFGVCSFSFSLVVVVAAVVVIVINIVIFIPRVPSIAYCALCSYTVPYIAIANMIENVVWWFQFQFRLLDPYGFQFSM